MNTFSSSSQFVVHSSYLPVETTAHRCAVSGCSAVATSGFYCVECEAQITSLLRRDALRELRRLQRAARGRALLAALHASFASVCNAVRKRLWMGSALLLVGVLSWIGFVCAADLLDWIQL